MNKQCFSVSFMHRYSSFLTLGGWTWWATAENLQLSLKCLELLTLKKSTNIQKKLGLNSPMAIIHPVERLCSTLEDIRNTGGHSVRDTQYSGGIAFSAWQDKAFSTPEGGHSVHGRKPYSIPESIQCTGEKMDISCCFKQGFVCFLRCNDSRKWYADISLIQYY